MRTTIDLDDALLAQVKQVAARNNTTMASVIEDAVRQTLARKKTGGKKKTRLTTVSGKGVRPGIDLDDMASLLNVMERRR